MYNKIMIFDDQIKDEKLQYISREGTKISSLSPGKKKMNILQVKKHCLLNKIK